MGDFALGVFVTLCAVLVVGMMAFGPQVLEWIDNPSREPG